VKTWLRPSLWDVVPRDQRDSPGGLRRRQAVTLAVVLVGAGLLGLLLRVEPGSGGFYATTLALAATWAVGAFAAGPLHLGRIPRWRDRDDLVRPVVAPVVLALGMAAVFTLGALVVREVPWLERQVAPVVDLADGGALPLLVVVTAVNGAAEELFFRGAAYAAIPRHPVAWTTLAYTAATLATGNVMLAFAAAALGVMVGLERRASGGVLAPVLTHVTWSLSMLLVLPAVLA